MTEPAPAATLLDDARVAAATRRAAAGLRVLGCATDDAVALLAGNVPEHVAVRDATAALGLRCVPVNGRLAPPEVAHVVLASGARVLVVHADHAALAAAALATPPSAAGVRVVTTAELDALGAGKPAAVEPDPAAIGATILFTSGTTGRPKGCLRTAAQEGARADELAATYALHAGDVHLVVSPVAHSAPGILLRAARRAGARTVLLERFEPRAVLAAIERFRATVVFLVPTQVARLLALPDPERRAPDLASLRAVIVAGAPFAQAAKERLCGWLGPGRLWEFYGASETGTVSVVPPSAAPGPPGFVGWPPAGVAVRVAGDDGAEAGPGEVGEVFVRSAAVMAGYLDGTDALRTADGHLSVGDLGRRDARGGLTLVDRRHDVVITGGVNVYPAEVERVLGEHPDVAGAIVCGVPHADWGEELVALVAIRPGRPLDEDAVRAFLRDRLAAYKIPKRFAIVPEDELPIGASGKPLRRRARERFGDG